MGFTTRVEGYFPIEVRRAGARYAFQGRVELLDVSDRRLRATVDGGSAADEVVLDWSGYDELQAACTCPQFGGGRPPCKHIWAVGMAADTLGHMASLARGGALRLVTRASLLENVDAVDREASLRRLEPPHAGMPQPAKRTVPEWKKALAPLKRTPWEEPKRAVPAGRGQSLYVLDGSAGSSGTLIHIEHALRLPRADGSLGEPKIRYVRRDELGSFADPQDRFLLTTLLGAKSDSGWTSHASLDSFGRFELPTQSLEILLPKFCETGRFFLRRNHGYENLEPLAWRPEVSYEIRLRIRRDAAAEVWQLEAYLQRQPAAAGVASTGLMIKAGYVVGGEEIAPLKNPTATSWYQRLGGPGPLSVPSEDDQELLAELFALPNLPPVDWPEALGVVQVELPPELLMTIRRGGLEGVWGERLLAEPWFVYGSTRVLAGTGPACLNDLEKRRVWVRDRTREQEALANIVGVDLKPLPKSLVRWKPDLANISEIRPKSLPAVVRELSARGWRVEAEGKLYHSPGAVSISVRSGIDWFDLQAEVQFGDKKVRLPALLKALKRGENTILLDDGTFGLLPEEWLRKHGFILSAGEEVEGQIRYQRSQVGFLDALLAAQPAAHADEVFEKARQELRSFDGIAAEEPPRSFQGKLRPYQKDALGWLRFLRRFNLGGILADDMGLGKTVQVLALLEARRKERRDKKTRQAGPRVSLAVVPKSLVFNWQSEAQKFAPRLKILEHTGAERTRAVEHFEDFDLVLTTYGTLRRDAAFLKDKEFDYVILDEAQAIKNARSESSKATRLLQGQHRLALSGTPIENHLGELWSLFEFLNPGMLGASAAFEKLSGGAARGSAESLTLLQRSLRPFILRRTKGQVAKDLPEKLEQTLLCDLDPGERKLYDELRDHFRLTLTRRIKEEGLAKSKMNVLEALLRLRQAACHPGLIDDRRVDDESSKLDLLLAKLEAARQEGHKTLVFSQFTKLLGILRRHLDRQGVVYEYLDGQTSLKDRARVVERFQSDPACPLFLISLKAGGLGLNLTAADYVFLLDPWWNPAVEAQAIDRTHRIGQTRAVFAYRIVARGTVEEKVLELQKSKRELADSIINADASLIQDLSREDLELLLS